MPAIARGTCTPLVAKIFWGIPIFRIHQPRCTPRWSCNPSFSASTLFLEALIREWKKVATDARLCLSRIVTLLQTIFLFMDVLNAVMRLRCRLKSRSCPHMLHSPIVANAERSIVYRIHLWPPDDVGSIKVTESTTRKRAAP